MKRWGAAVVLLLATAIGVEAQGQRIDRAGIGGDPIPLESEDPRYGEYFAKVRQRIQAKWSFPCVNESEKCELKTTELVVEFGIAQDGRLAFIDVARPSPWSIYNDSAVRAITLASPFPAVPDAIQQGNGIPIIVKFSYVNQLPRGFLR